jgi:hypothetical protein
VSRRLALLLYPSPVSRSSLVFSLFLCPQLKIQQELIAEQSRRVVISESSVCGVPTCRRLIGNTAILCYPNGTVVHFACGRYV